MNTSRSPSSLSNSVQLLDGSYEIKYEEQREENINKLEIKDEDNQLPSPSLSPKSSLSGSVILSVEKERFEIKNGRRKIENVEEFGVKAHWEYRGTEPEELSFAEGECITITGRMGEWWWFGKSETGQTGLVPSNFFEIIKKEE